MGNGVGGWLTVGAKVGKAVDDEVGTDEGTGVGSGDGRADGSVDGGVLGIPVSGIRSTVANALKAPGVSPYTDTQDATSRLQ